MRRAETPNLGYLSMSAEHVTRTREPTGAEMSGHINISTYHFSRGTLHMRTYVGLMKGNDLAARPNEVSVVQLGMKLRDYARQLGVCWSTLQLWLVRNRSGV